MEIRIERADFDFIILPSLITQNEAPKKPTCYELFIEYDEQTMKRSHQNIQNCVELLQLFAR